MFSALSFVFVFSQAEEMKKCGAENLEKENQNRRFLQCPGSVTVNHLKKFIMTKYGLDQNFLVDVIYKEDLLPEDQTLIDIAYSYNWRKVGYRNLQYSPCPQPLCKINVETFHQKGRTKHINSKYIFVGFTFIFSC